MLGQVDRVRALMRGNRTMDHTTVDFAVPHMLSLTYIPKWLTALEAGFGVLHTRLTALNVHDAVLTLVEGGCDLLLCYHHPRQPVQLDPRRYDMLNLGSETLRAYARCDRSGKPDFELPGTSAASLPFLSDTTNAYLGRMVEPILSDAEKPLHLEKRYETDMAESLKMMALEEHGLVFLPDSSVVREVKKKQLAIADHNEEGWQVQMEIRLYRERPSLQRPGKPLVERLWDFLLESQRSKYGKSVKNKAKK